ncbi:hypothetical protein GGF45_005777, partial [Coemansia sp. RSA 551]
MESRQRANTLGLDAGGGYQRARKVSGGGHVYEDMDIDYMQRPYSKAAAIADETSAMAAPRVRSRTVAIDGPSERPRSVLMMGRPMSALMVDAPDSPSVTGMKGRHRLQREASAQGEAG